MGLDATYSNLPGREVPNPLVIDICRGVADINVVVRDILALTKLNYNACIFGDGMPITLKFADAVGEILTAGPINDVPSAAVWSLDLVGVLVRGADYLHFLTTA
jgi:hypothetical protein